MKKLTALTLALLLLALTACSGTPVIAPPRDPAPPAEENAQPQPDLPADGTALKTGLALVPSLGASKSAGEEPGLAQVDSTVTAVTFRGEEISSCIIDAAQCKVNFDSAGTITTDITAVPLTKNQLGRNYGMHKASSIGKEWSEQAEAFAQYAVGKTVEEIQGIALNEKGGPADADLAASVTLNPGSFQQVLALAHELR